MKKQYGVILVLVLIFLILLSLFTISILHLNVEATMLINMQNTYDKLFVAAETELQLAEAYVTRHNIIILTPPQLVTDQQFINDLIPSGIFKYCTYTTTLQQQCYYIELIARENCISEIDQQNLAVLFYRITARVSVVSLVNQSDILQSTYAMLPSNIKKCRLLNSLTGTEYYLYAGRQSWREIIH